MMIGFVAMRIAMCLSKYRKHENNIMHTKMRNEELERSVMPAGRPSENSTKEN